MHLDGSYAGFLSHLRANGSPGMAGTIELGIDQSAGSVAARVAPMQWEGASWELTAADGQYSNDHDFGGSNITNDPGYTNALSADATAGSLCDCDYLSWGRWNAGIDANGTRYGPVSGYWVVGQLTDSAALPSTGVYQYTGAAHGEVSVAGATPYAASGTFSALVDFAAGSGNLQISDFDGRSFGNDVVDITGSGQLAWGFADSLSSVANPNLGGEFTAGFASDGSDPAAGMIGTFSASDGDWAASGIFGGAGQPVGSPP